MNDIIYKHGHTGDTKLSFHQGRIVIYDNKLLVSVGNAKDHTRMLGELAARYKMLRKKVITDGIRLYYSSEKGDIIVSPSRKYDDEILHDDLKHYMGLIYKKFIGGKARRKKTKREKRREFLDLHLRKFVDTL